MHRSHRSDSSVAKPNPREKNMNLNFTDLSERLSRTFEQAKQVRDAILRENLVNFNASFSLHLRSSALLTMSPPIL
jgi:hypothetical protein